MKHALRPFYDRTIELFRADDRVLAAYMTGSVGTPREDEYADVDPSLLVRSADFDAFDHDLMGFFGAVGAHPILRWPERCNCETIRNWAVFFEHEGDLLQYDITIERHEVGLTRPIRQRQFIFDKAEVFQIVPEADLPVYDPARLRWTIELYWIYVYIHGKYLLRGDRFKLIAAQQELCQAHLEVLRALKPEVPFDWWPILARGLCEPGNEQAVLTYFGHTDAQSVAAALPEQIARFAADARAACEKWQVEYPADFEARVAEYIEHVTAGVH